MVFKVITASILAVLCMGCAPKSELDAAKAEVKKLNEQIVSLQAEATQNQQKIADLQSTLESSKTQLSHVESELAKNPPMPVKVTFRQAFMGTGYVATFTTTIKQDIPVMVTVKSQALGTVKDYRLDLSSVGSKEIGHAEGSPIEEGDEITVKNNNYLPLTVVFKH